MRQSIITIAALAVLAGCGGGGSPQLQLDRTRLLFGQDYGNAVLLGTQPINTLQILNTGKGDLTISKVEVVSGTDADGGALGDVAAFTASQPDKATVPANDEALVQVVFNPDHTGLFGAILRITSNDPKSPTTDVVLSGDCVTPLVTILDNDGGTDLTLPTVTLVPRTAGSTDYATQIESTDVLFANSGTFALQFQDAKLAADAGDSPFTVCTNTIQGGACQPGPLPNTLDRAYPDGGLALRAYGDGGYAGAARLTVVFTATTPGDYTDHVIVDSTATNAPELVFTVHASANAQ